MSEPLESAPDHGVIDGAPSVPPPLAPTRPAPRLSNVEEARTLVAATNVAALATVEAATNDIPGGSALYAEMFEDTATALARSGQLISDSQRDAVKAIVDVTLAAQEQFSATMRQVAG